MLKRIPGFVDADLLWVLAAMGHGDELVVVDRNFPAFKTARTCASRKLVALSGIDAPTAIRGILQLLPLDSFVPTPLRWIDPVDTPGKVLPVHSEVLAVCHEFEAAVVGHEAVERFAFYEAARSAFAVVQTGESRPYGCFILKKGIIFEAPAGTVT